MVFMRCLTILKGRIFLASKYLFRDNDKERERSVHGQKGKGYGRY